MELKVTKEYSDIVTLLEHLKETLDIELEVMQQEFQNKFSLEITKEILDYATELVRLKISVLFDSVVKEFNRFTILLDCTEIGDLNMNEVEAIIHRIARQMQEKLPQGAGSDKIEIEIKKYLRKLICKVPSKWTIPVVKQFLQQFEDTLSQLGVIIS